MLLALSSYVSAAIDGISITGNIANSSMVHTGTVETGEIGAAVDSSPVLSGVVDASIVESETGVPSLVLEEVTNGVQLEGVPLILCCHLKELLVRLEKGL